MSAEVEGQDQGLGGHIEMMEMPEKRVGKLLRCLDLKEPNDGWLQLVAGRERVKSITSKVAKSLRGRRERIPRPSWRSNRRAEILKPFQAQLNFRL